MTLRLKDLEIQMKTDRQNDENEKTTLQQEKEKLHERLFKFEEKLKDESEGIQGVEKRLQSLESKSDSFASKLSLFEKLSSTERGEGRQKLQGPSLSLWGEDRRTGRDSITTLLTSSSLGYKSLTDSLTEQHESVSEAEDQSPGGQLKTAEGGREPVIVLASDGIAAERQGGKLGQYRLSGELNKSPYYVQSSNISHSSPVYLYRTEDNQWWVSDVLG